MNIIEEGFKMLFPSKPKDTKITLTKSAYEAMGEWGLKESDIRDVALNGKEVKANMYSRIYNGYAIGIIAKYDSLKKEYLVLTAWKRPWRK